MDKDLIIDELDFENLRIEYQMLRNEITSRLKIQTEMLAFMVGALAILFGVGLRYPQIVKELLLLIPFLTLSTGFHYASVVSAVRRIGKYIREEIEPKLKGIRWQEHYREYKFKNYDVEHSYEIGITFTFILPTLLSVIIGIIINFLDRNLFYLIIELFYLLFGIILTRVFWVVTNRNRDIILIKKCIK